MKFLIFFAILAVAHCGPLKSQDIKTFDEFKAFYGKSYDSLEEAARKENFENSLKYITENQGKYGVQMAINEFSDMSDEEFFAKNAYISTLNQTQLLESVPLEDQSEFYATLPAHWDWREKIHWNPIEQQGHCGSCWAFATVQTVEAAYAIKHKISVHLSKQELVDCTLNSYNHQYINQGCKLGYTTEALKYLKVHGVYEEKLYPYNGRANEACYLNKLAGHKQYHINDYRRLAHGCPDTAIQQALYTYGPVVVNINDSDAAFKHYHNGIIRNLMPNIARTTHSVVLVGWGTEHGVDYWVIRNSWGSGWGDHGYARIERHHNLMGLNNQVVFPVLH